MAVKKSDFSSIWASCHELRGGMDASQCKDYVLFDEIADPKNDFHLNLPRYIDASAPEDTRTSTATCAVPSAIATSTRSLTAGALSPMRVP